MSSANIKSQRLKALRELAMIFLVMIERDKKVSSFYIDYLID